MILQLDFLQEFAAKLLHGMGSSPEVAAHVSESLIAADARGRTTHGIAILPLYAEMIAAGAIDPSATPKVNHLTDNMIGVDGRMSFGQLTGKRSVDSAVDAIDNGGVVVVGIRNGSHLGRLGEWAELATARGLIFMAFVNTSGGARNVAAFGGCKRKLSTNPVAFGLPSFGALPFNIIADFATSQVSGSVIREHYRAQTTLHADWTTSESGSPLKEAASFMEGAGALLPLGGRVAGHKGFGLALVAELLGGMAGGMVVGQHDPEWFSNCGMFILIDPARFLDEAEIKLRIGAVAKHLHDEDQVRLPGEGAHHRLLKARKEGVEVQDYVLQSLKALAADFAVDLPEQLSGLAATTTKTNFRSW